MPRDPVRIRRNGPYAPLSANYADDDKIAQLDVDEDDRAELLYIRSLAFCARDPKLDGFISSVVLRTGRVFRRKFRKGQDIFTVAERLVKVGLWVPETDGYRIANWSKWNRTADEIEAARKADNARKGRPKADGTGTEDDD